MPLDFSSDRKHLATFGLAGLADIVLLLLIFFLLTSNFIPQFGIQVNLPEASTAPPTEAQFVTVVITDEGQYYVEAQQTAEERLLDAIQAVQGDKSALVLRADPEATVAQFATVASIAKALELRVLMATEREDSGRR